ncbi:MAG TPA: glycosyltransferase family 39 protein [Vicinamibacterales bacterium]
MVRTPIYPLLSGGVEAFAAAIWPLYLLQVVLSVGTALLVCGIAAAILGRGPALFAGCLYAVDLCVAGINFEALSEPLFVFLSMLGIFVWIRTYAVQPSRHFVRAHLFAGALLGVALLTRPAGIYLPAVLAVAGAGILAGRYQWRALIGPVLLVFAAYAVAAPWVARNNRVHGIPRLTNADSINLAYFAGAAVYQLKYGIDREQAQERIASEFDLPPLGAANNTWRLQDSVRNVDGKQRAAAREILTANPLLFAQASAIGVAKSFGSHSSASIAAMAGRTWSPPGLSSIADGDFMSVWQSIRRNDAWIVAVFAWQMLIAGTVTVSALAGVWLLLLRRHSIVAAGLLLPALYSVATIAVVGVDAYWRHRLPITPIACILAGYGMFELRCRLAAPRPAANEPTALAAQAGSANAA